MLSIMACCTSAITCEFTADGLGLATRLLKLLLTSSPSSAFCSQSSQQHLHQQQQQLDGSSISRWLLSWLQAVTDGPLVEAAAAAKADMPAVLAALLTAGSATHSQPSRSNRFAQQAAAGRQLLLNDDDWLPMIVKAAAQAEEIELVCACDAADDGNDDEDAGDAGESTCNSP